MNNLLLAMVVFIAIIVIVFYGIYAIYYAYIKTKDEREKIIVL